MVAQKPILGSCAATNRLASSVAGENSQMDQKMMNRIGKLALATLFCWTAGAHAQEPLSLDELVKAFGWDFEAGEIKVEQLGEGFYALFGIGGNILVSVGKDGTLLVDDQFPQLMPKIEAALAELGSDGVDFVINTHWHFDHAEGNLHFGPAGVPLIAQINSRNMMADTHVINLVGVSYRQEPYPESAWPTITYDDTMQVHFNGERIDLLHFGPAHTTGDTAVFFRGQNAVHLGDIFNTTGYPFIDAGNGGSIDGVITFSSAVRDIINTDTKVIPGHGPVADYHALVDYIDMLTVVRDRIAGLVEQGMSLEAIIAVKPTAEFDERYGDPARLIDRAYYSLTR